MGYSFPCHSMTSSRLPSSGYTLQNAACTLADTLPQSRHICSPRPKHLFLIIASSRSVPAPLSAACVRASQYPLPKWLMKGTSLRGPDRLFRPASRLQRLYSGGYRLYPCVALHGGYTGQHTCMVSIRSSLSLYQRTCSPNLMKSYLSIFLCLHCSVVVYNSSGSPSLILR